VSLNYAEACVAASKRDFIHKTRLSLKEIRESKENLSVLAMSENKCIKKIVQSLIGECGELNAILYKSVKTATENLRNGI
jgi:four helix bundle protein